MKAKRKSDRLEAGILGRTLRLMLAALLGWMAFAVLRFEDTEYNLRVLAVFGGATVIYTVVHFVISKYAARLNPWLGAGMVVVPLVLVFLFANPLLRMAATGYLAVSLLLQAVRADAGCEVFSIPTFLVRRPTHLVGLLFAPIDVVEKYLTGPGGLPG